MGYAARLKFKTKQLGELTSTADLFRYECSTHGAPLRYEGLAAKVRLGKSGRRILKRVKRQEREQAAHTMKVAAQP